VSSFLRTFFLWDFVLKPCRPPSLPLYRPSVSSYQTVYPPPRTFFLKNPSDLVSCCLISDPSESFHSACLRSPAPLFNLNPGRSLLPIYARGLGKASSFQFLPSK